MQKLYSEIIGTAVFDEHSRTPIALVQDVIIDPENGNLLAFLVSKKRIIVPLDIERFNSGLHIRDRDEMLALSDVLRVQQVYEKSICITGSRVITERGKNYLGRVVDYEVDATQMVLTKIHVAKIFFFFRINERVISSKNIVRINKDLIIVKGSNVATIKDEAVVQSSVFAA